MSFSQPLGVISYPLAPGPAPNPLESASVGQAAATPGAAFGAAQLGTGAAGTGGPGESVGAGGAQGLSPATPGVYRGRSASRTEALELGEDAPTQHVHENTFPIPNASTPRIHELEPGEAGADAFHEAISGAKTAHPNGAAVYVYPRNEYRDMRLFLTPDRKAGVALKGSDIVSVFKHPDANHYKNITRSLLDVAVGQGGRRLDAFDTMLPHLYGQSGFRAVARQAWDDEYKPPGWNYEDFKKYNKGRPDVVFMVHDPAAPRYEGHHGKQVKDYDEGIDAQHAALADVTARLYNPVPYGTGQPLRVANPLLAYHSSPHLWPPTPENPLGAFSLGKLGTGEGHAAFAEGPYVAQNEETAQDYLDSLKLPWTYRGQPPPPTKLGDPYNIAVRKLGEMIAEPAVGATPAESKDALMATYRNWVDGQRSTAQNPNVAPDTRAMAHTRADWDEQTLRHLERLDPADFTGPRGYTYETEVHIDPKHMLDWDRPLHQQSDYVQDRVNRLPGWQGIDSAWTGQRLHLELTRGPGGDDPDDQSLAAKHLLDAGIPGVKYADQGSRKLLLETFLHRNKILTLQHEGAPPREIEREKAYLQRAEEAITRNFVVFDPQTMRVISRQGVDGTVAHNQDALAEYRRGGKPP